MDNEAGSNCLSCWELVDGQAKVAMPGGRLDSDVDCHQDDDGPLALESIECRRSFRLS